MYKICKDISDVGVVPMITPRMIEHRYCPIQFIPFLGIKIDMESVIFTDGNYQGTDMRPFRNTLSFNIGFKSYVPNLQGSSICIGWRLCNNDGANDNYKRILQDKIKDFEEVWEMIKRQQVNTGG